MLYIIGTGLNDCKDISLRSLEILRDKVDVIYQECYTCIQATDFGEIEELIGKKIILADRKMVEEQMVIVDAAKASNVAFLVAGTPFFATTHTDIFLRAKEHGIETRVIHNTSILNVCGCYGLYSYNYGKTISVPYFTETCKYISCYDNIYNNWINKLHTLCLLDIKTDENRFMTANEAIEQLLYCEGERKKGLFTPETELLVVCRFSTENELVKFGMVAKLLDVDFGAPLHSLIIPGGIDCVEREMIQKWFSL